MITSASMTGVALIALAMVVVTLFINIRLRDSRLGRAWIAVREDEVAAAAGVHIVTAHLRTDRPLLWARIQDRLAREPHRLALNEDSQEWMDRTLAFYDGMRW